MRTLIIGANGLLGKALMEQWESDQVTGVGPQDADIRDPDALRRLFDRARPQYTVLLAAYTDVDGCEKDPRRADEVNRAGAIHVAEAARNAGSGLMFLSTDYVFDGTKKTPYEKDDPVNPINVYGRSKAEAEHGIREILPACCILRTSWLFGAGGRCFPNTILELALTREKLTVVHDQKGSPTFNRDLAAAIIKLATAGTQGTLHLTNAGACTWFELAREVVRAADLTEVTVEPVTTAEFPRPARRPTYSVLANSSAEQYGIFMRPWQQALGDYLAERRSVSQVQGSMAR